MKKLILLITVMIIYSAPGYSVEKMLIAVLDLKGNGVSKMVSYAVSDLIRSEMVKTGMFRVMERSQMDEVLKDQGFSKEECTDQSCAVKIGKVLSVRKILMGEINKMGRSYMITVRIVDVERGISGYSANEKAAGEDDMDRASIKITSKLTKNIYMGNKAYFTFQTPQGYYLRSIVPGWGQFYVNRPVKGYIFLGAFVLAGGFVGYSLYDYTVKRSAYEDMTSGTDQEFKDRYDASQSAVRMGKISIGIFAAVYVLHWTDVLFFSRPDFDKLSGNRDQINPDKTYLSFYVSHPQLVSSEKFYRVSVSLRF